MTAPLRQAHLRTWLVMSLLLAALALASFVTRRPPTPANSNFTWEQLR